MVDSRVGYCPCGREIWIEYLWTGQAFTCRFTDSDGVEVAACPDCGRVIAEDDLESM